MQQAQIVTYGIDGVLAERLREFTQARRIWLRETSQHAACRNLVNTTAPPIVIIVLGADLERELTLIERVHESVPETAIIAIVETDNPTLAGLAWDLGAAFVLAPPMPIERIIELIERILDEAAS